MVIGSALYRFILVLHIVCAIAGFGAVFLNGVYAAFARKRPPAEALAITEANYFISTKPARALIYATGLFGFVLIFLSGGAWTFSQTWVWLSIVIYFVAMGISHGAIAPLVRRVIALQKEMIAAGSSASAPPPQAAELQALGKKIGPIAGSLHLALLVMVYLMVFKPGFQ